jgi:D-alanyl-D-alanine carboxypeptidase/D-alanyl-D-alanine-endopeptidase (penicillin-binding protein 4)
MASNHLSDTLDADLCISYAEDNLMTELKNNIHWVDGSGLSRYNKFTPRAMTGLLQKIYDEYSKETIIELFPIGGVSGTLKNNFKNEIPFIVAKTGSLKNVYNLSGFLITSKKRWFIFSFMNNNFEVSTSSVKSEMEKVLKNIYLKF